MNGKTMDGKKKFLIPVIVAVVVVLLIVALVNVVTKEKEPVTKETFAKTLKASDFEVVDQSSMIVEGSDFSVVYLAQPKGDSEKADESADEPAEENGSGLFTGQYQMEYYEFNDADLCEKNFDRLDDELVAAYKNADKYSTTEKTAGNYAKRTVKTDKRYYVISRVDNTLVISIAPLEKSDNINKILDELGYN